ncbi:hypothetical protein ACFYNO_05295 [Kitasatospora sp. NPDC006697]|uniref:hypothetical protein n=1 Tax=Kitasatospora sp. NPDC006697 TaxID=3364020 RepID=UPI0036A8ADF2
MSEVLVLGWYRARRVSSLTEGSKAKVLRSAVLESMAGYGPTGVVVIDQFRG